MIGGRLGRVKLVTLRVGATPLLLTRPCSPHFLPSFRVSTCAFASKTFARPKKTPALQAKLVSNRWYDASGNCGLKRHFKNKAFKRYGQGYECIVTVVFNSQNHGRATQWEEEEEEPLLIYTAQGNHFRRKKLSVISGSPEKQRTKTTLNTVSYTHLTLPTIYSV